jgi:hypothetical protein
MSIVCEDYKILLDSYINTIPTYNLLFRVTKGCGYSQLVTVSRNRPCNYYHPPLVNLLEQINLQMGEWTRDKIYYYPKITNLSEDGSSSHAHKYLHHENLFEPLISFASKNLQTAYSVNDCQYTVYQLYLEEECTHSFNCTSNPSRNDMELELELDLDLEIASQPMQPPDLPPATPANYTPSAASANIDYIV